MATKSLNKVMLIGNVGKDADIRYSAGGFPFSYFSIATNERFKPQGSDEWQERTEWHNITLLGKLAEAVSEYVTKGTRVYVEGRLQSREYTDKDGIARKVWDVIANDLILLGGKGDGTSLNRPPHPADTYAAQAPTHTGTVSDNNYPAPPDAEEEVPF